jgi:hypothetical protein
MGATGFSVMMTAMDFVVVFLPETTLMFTVPLPGVEEKIRKLTLPSSGRESRSKTFADEASRRENEVLVTASLAPLSSAPEVSVTESSMEAVSPGSTLAGADVTVIVAGMSVPTGSSTTGGVGSRDFPGSQEMRARTNISIKDNTNGFRWRVK